MVDLFLFICMSLDIAVRPTVKDNATWIYPQATVSQVGPSGPSGTHWSYFTTSLRNGTTELVSCASQGFSFYEEDVNLGL